MHLIHCENHNKKEEQKKDNLIALGMVVMLVVFASLII
ncbi:putative membrane protein [Candidatus Phytoplasma solani]